jgi:ABC-2 type transport system permease protein
MILNLAWKELVQLIRDRVLLAFLIVAPAIQLVLIAEATGAGIRGIRLAVWDQDKSALSHDVVTALENANTFRLTHRAQSYEEIEDLIRQGTVGAAAIIPPDFSRDASRPGSSGVLLVILDATNIIKAKSLVGVLDGVVAALVEREFAALGSADRRGGIELRVEMAFNPTLNIRWTTLITQLGFITYQIVLVVAAVGFVRERELGTLEQLAVTPISRLELMLGKGLMALGLGLLNLFLLYLVLILGFDIPMRGSFALFVFLGILFTITEISVGTLVSVMTTSQQQAILMVFLLAMLEVTFSGYLVPTENMPMFMQVFANFSPLQHFSAILRAIFLKGSTLLMLTHHVLPLVALTLVTTGVAWFLFSRAEW